MILTIHTTVCFTPVAVICLISQYSSDMCWFSSSMFSYRYITSQVIQILNCWIMWQNMDLSENSSSSFDFFIRCLYFRALMHSCHKLILMVIPWFTQCLLVSVGHQCNIPGCFQKSTNCAKWIAMNCNYCHNVNVTLWRHKHGHGCLQTPIISY